MSKNFLEFHSLSAQTVYDILNRACELKALWADRSIPQTLKGKRIGLIVDDTGWRNTAAFDLGAKSMGGICVQIPISFNGREATADLAGYLSNWFDLIVIRTRELEVLQELASVIEIPVINARTRSNHPCETLGDLAYVKGSRGTIEGLKVAGIAPDANIFRSWVEASKCLPIQVTQVYPERWHVRDPALINPNFNTTTNLEEAFRADVIITDSWPSDALDGELLHYQVSADLLDRISKNVFFLPCPPVARGQEVTTDAMSHAACQSREAKAYLLHAQNALMEHLLV